MAMKKAVNPGMKRSRTPWATKLRPEMQPAVVEDPKGRGNLLLPTPLLIADAISRVEPGELMDVPGLRNELAARHGADLTCPLMTGIFLNIIAGAAEEQIASGEKPLAPWWRIIPANGILSDKTPCGPARQAEHLREEGHPIERKGEKFRVTGFRR
jgi:hypothetical protein